MKLDNSNLDLSSLQLQFEYVRCDICGSERSWEVMVGDRHNLGLRTVICSRCSLVYTNPRPTEQALNNFYAHHYRTLYEATSIPSAEYIKQGDFDFRASIVADHLSSWIDSIIEKKGVVTILDIGCSEGSTLRRLNEEYGPQIKTVGIEPSLEFSKFASSYANATVFPGTLEEFVTGNSPQSTSSVDIIILNHVLEHFPSPTKQLEIARSLLENDGFIFVEVPNILGPWQGKSMLHLAHLYNFSELTLTNLLAKVGFAIQMVSHEGNHLHPWGMAVVAKKAPPCEIELPEKAAIKDIYRRIRARLPQQRGGNARIPLKIRRILSSLKRRSPRA